ncbi:MAG: TonB-dependent siderophore receptor [Candidatus Accumulibacter sp.]|jgi:outer membrane receptor for ferric coprogen and ferric-rhodotorulic acid|nr:TonB-dependent siderophore receptor [Accumulibacter sp.]
MNANTSIRSGHEAAKRTSKRLPPTRIALLLALAYTPLASAQTESQAAAEESQGTLEAVEVTASPLGESYTSTVSVGGKEAVKPREIPQSVTVITKKRIEDQGAVILSDVLKLVPGVTAQPNDSRTGDDTYYVRGYTLNATYDGVPSINGFGTYPGLDMAIYEQVEVLRGPAGLFQGALYGPSFGGVVNFVRKRGPREFAASAKISAGTWDNYNTVVDVGGPLNASGSLRARAIASNIDRGYFYDDAKNHKFLGYLNVDWDITPSTAVSLAYSSQKNRIRGLYTGVPVEIGTGALLKLPRSTNLNPEWNSIDWDTQDIQAEIVHRFDNGWSINAKYNHREQDNFQRTAFWSVAGVPPANGNITYIRNLVDNEYDTNSYDIYLGGPFKLFGLEHQAVVGYNYSKFHLRRASENCLTNAASGAVVPFGQKDLVQRCDDRPYRFGLESQYWQSGYYGQLRLRLAEPLTLLVGARVSDYHLRSRTPPPAANTTDWTNSPSNTNNEVTPYGGLVFDVNKQISLYASYAEIFTPNSSEKFEGGVIDPNEGQQYEIGSKGEFFGGRLIASLAYFNMRDTNRSYADPDHPGYSLALGEVESKGWEVEVAGSPAPGWDIHAGYTRLETRFKKDRIFENLKFSPKEPKHLVKLWGVHRFAEGPLAGLSAGLGVTYVGETRGSVANNLASYTASIARKQSAYTLTDAFLSYRINNRASVAFNAYNLFDKRYYSRLATGATGGQSYYGEPRSYKLTLNVQY